MPGLASKKMLLLERFDIARKQNAELISEIGEYARMNDAYDTHFMANYSFRSGMNTLEEERDLVFNDTNRMAILGADDEAKELDFLISKIEAQINHYAEIKMGLNIFFKGSN
jgi:hypothetical protein